MTGVSPISEDDAKALFDLATNSMDFGSGFLDTPEVEILRRVAVQLGLDPMEATPSPFRSQYKHPFEQEAIRPEIVRCKWGCHDQSYNWLGPTDPPHVNEVYENLLNQAIDDE